MWNEYAKFGSFPENLVKKDEVFSISKYASLPLIEMMGLKVTALCSGRQKLGPIKGGINDGKPRSPMYTFEFKLSAADTATFKANRTALALAQVEAQRQLNAKTAGALPVTPSSNAGHAHQTHLGA